MIELNSKQRKLLEKYATSLEPVVLVGAAGVTEGVTQKILQSLECHELIKVKFNEFKEEKHELIKQISETLDANIVRIIGNVAILYKPATEQKDRTFEKELLKKVN